MTSYRVVGFRHLDHHGLDHRQVGRHGMYGAKGAAEVNICPPMAAIANAIERAVGTRLTELPMSPVKVRAAIDAKGRK
jgi:CO/xanthine dehydrogenase Mo-binding subunit